MVNLLIIEDENALAELIKSAVQGSDVQVDICNSAEEATEQLGCKDYRLLFVDINLPGESGLEFIERTRAALPDAMFVVISANSARSQIAQGYDFGADFYLPKPFELEQLEGIVRAFKNRQELQTENHSLWLQRVDRTIISSLGKKIVLTEPEFIVLFGLVTAKGYQLEYWEIAERLELDLESDFKPYLALLVTRLRKKLNELAGSSSIHSVRNFGYRLALSIGVS